MPHNLCDNVSSSTMNALSAEHKGAKTMIYCPWQTLSEGYKRRMYQEGLLLGDIKHLCTIRHKDLYLIRSLQKLRLPLTLEEVSCTVFLLVPIGCTYFNSTVSLITSPCTSIQVGVSFFHPPLSPHPSPLPSMPPYTSRFPHLSCIISHLAHTSHPGHDALVVAFPRHLAEEKVYLIIIWVVGVCNGMSRYKPGLWRHGEEKRESVKISRVMALPCVAALRWH